MARDRRGPAVRQFQAIGERPAPCERRLQPTGRALVAALRVDPEAARQSVTLHQLQPILSAAIGDQFSGLTSTTADLKPERFDNYELGAKWAPIDGLLATAAIYRLDRTNTRAIDPLTQQTVLTGAQRSKGLELGLERSISDRWQVSAGYSWQKAEITKTTASAPAGRDVPLVPKHSFSLWNRYDVSDTIGLGLGVIARSKSYASISNNVKLPGYARVDAAAYYKLMLGIEAQINVENIFGADYFPTAHSDNNIAPGGPRAIKAQLRFGF
ncbi:TonB-dependent receptor [Sphingomonas sediminicola]|uniref:TonB-dependent receptor n=1 Tax=Sphingomonas sediminicola TaxID=386874 RepID=A0ABX6T5P9_9SPHN|nr:TonB-dependent receptor [Sphingomonas sediminicola]